MQTYISILRGINVSGHKMIKMEDLRKMYENLGFFQVKSYIQSGNVVFQGEITNCAVLEKLISAKINEDFGFDVPVIVRDVFEWKNLILGNPFMKDKAIDSSKFHLTLLSNTPTLAAIEKLNEHQQQDDQFVLIEKNVYLFCPNGYGNTKLSNSFFENKLKVVATTRNWKTINELGSLAEKIV